MTLRLKLALGLALAAFAACHVAAAYKIDASVGRQLTDAMTLQGD
jgi:hypothetical protein